MLARIKIVGAFLVVAGLAFVAVGGYTFMRTQAGASSLAAFSAAQNVTLSYNDQGQLVDHGTVEGAQAIMDLLTNEWQYPVNKAEFDPRDPVVNTASEYMYQLAAVTEHTISSTVALTADVKDRDGNVVAHAGDKIPVDGRYYADFNYANPVDGAVRASAWNATALALIANLGVGTVTATSIQMGYGVAAMAGALGLVLFMLGLGMAWIGRAKRD